jgi:hypothetical protein
MLHVGSTGIKIDGDSDKIMEVSSRVKVMSTVDM